MSKRIPIFGITILCLLLIIIAICMLLITIPVFAGTYVENFNDGRDQGWDRWLDGKWEFADGKYVFTVIKDCARAVWGDMAWDDYTVEVRVRIKQLAYPGVDICVQDPVNRYIWALDSDSREISWVIQVNGNYNIVTRDPIPGNLFDEHIFRVAASGNTFEGYYDGKMIRRWQDANSTYRTGRVGISACKTGGQIAFDDFTITGDGIPDSEHSVNPLCILTTFWGKIKASSLYSGEI